MKPQLCSRINKAVLGEIRRDQRSVGDGETRSRRTMEKAGCHFVFYFTTYIGNSFFMKDHVVGRTDGRVEVCTLGESPEMTQTSGEASSVSRTTTQHCSRSLRSPCLMNKELVLKRTGKSVKAENARDKGRRRLGVATPLPWGISRDDIQTRIFERPRVQKSTRG